MRTVFMLLASTLVLAACDGPKAKAGADQDKADRAAAKARDAQVDVLKKRERAVRSDADVQADRLEEQAKAIRDSAREQTKVLDAQAANVQAR